ncbi:MAG TPA: two-component sensor histidine kinase, partial [Bacillus bacterium]|nr:two-component sensor histidine kinase [Bacillus sp. (in: firmicutes)]
KALCELNLLLSPATLNCTSSSASKLAAGLAHEIRNPLTTIKGFIQLLKPELQAIGKEEFTEVVLEEITRANDLLSEFLTVFKPAPPLKRNVSVNNLIHSMKKLFSSEATLKQIEFSSDVPVAEVNVFGVEKQLKQVLINLLKNAFEAVEENDRKKNRAVSLTLKSTNKDAEISINDNGCGIKEQVMNKMFTPFNTTKQKGTGIGLVICKQIIEEHGGSITVKSSPIGGTVFIIKLPLF